MYPRALTACASMRRRRSAGPLSAGAFLAQVLATRLAVKFLVVESAPAGSAARTTGLFTPRYQLPPGRQDDRCKSVLCEHAA
jgi:hypothetical protein